jgi:hypothetical protein
MNAGPASHGSSSVLEPPFYETYGEKQVAAGHYAKVLRYREHVRPIEEALRKLSRGHG